MKDRTTCKGRRRQMRVRCSAVVSGEVVSIGSIERFESVESVVDLESLLKVPPELGCPDLPRLARQLKDRKSKK